MAAKETMEHLNSKLKVRERPSLYSRTAKNCFIKGTYLAHNFGHWTRKCCLSRTNILVSLRYLELFIFTFKFKQEIFNSLKLHQRYFQEEFFPLDARMHLIYWKRRNVMKSIE